MKRKVGVLLFLIVVTVCAAAAQGPPPVPLTEEEVIDLLKSKQNPAQVFSLIQHRGINFELTPEIEKKLRKVKADNRFVELIKNVGPSARAASASGKGGIQVTAEEGPDLQAIVNEMDPDRTIQLVKEFEQKFPNSGVLAYAYRYAASACQQKNDVEHAIEYAEKSLKLKADDLASLLLLAYLIPQPNHLNPMSDGDKEKNLAQAENSAQQALKLIEELPKQ